MLSSAEYEAEWKWMQTPEAAKRSAAAKAKALSYFKQRYPNANMENLKVQVYFDKNYKPQARCFLSIKVVMVPQIVSIGPKL